MNLRQALEKAEKIVGGVRALSRETGWNSGTISTVKKGDEPLPPYRAAQVARIIGACELEAVLQAHADGAERRGAASEHAMWCELLRKHRTACPEHRGG